MTKDLFVNISKYNAVKNLIFVESNMHFVSDDAFSDFLHLASFECSTVVVWEYEYK